MKPWNWMIFIVIILSLSLSLFIACGDDDDDDDASGIVDDDDDDDDSGGDDDDANTCILNDVCNYVVENCEDSGGYADVAECAGMWLMDCNDAEGYMACACDCLDAATSCDNFINECEYPNCWVVYCD